MSDRVKDRRRSGAPPVGMPSKAERRALGKLAKKKRAAAQRRRRVLRKAIPVVAAIAVIVAIAAVFGAFGSDPEPGQQASTPSASQTAAAVDPALSTKPDATAGTGDLTKLTTTTLVEGKGAVVQTGETVSVNYVGVLYRTGEEFDSTWSRSQPFTFAVGNGEVIKGWDQGLVGVKVGSRVQLDVPADLAYGENASGGRPSGPLRFIIDVLSAT